MSVLMIERKILEKNDEIAARNRALFASHGIFALNIVSSPGSGKTSILERTIDHLRGAIPIAVVEGDVQTDLDAQRVERYGVPVVQIVTNGGCHLEAPLVRDALGNLPLEHVRVVFIENVGNLVCPSNYDLGEHRKVIVVSTTEGDDKPLKYPAMFQKASLLIINKMDLVPYLDSDPSILKRNALTVNPSLLVFETSCRSGAGIDGWCDWIRNEVSLMGVHHD